MRTAYSFLKKVSSWLERKVRDSCGKNVSTGDPAGAKSAEEAPGPPAESECLEWKSYSYNQVLFMFFRC